MNTEDKIKNEIHRKAHEGYVCSGNGNPELCYICDCIYRAINFTKAEILREIKELDVTPNDDYFYTIPTEKLKELETK